MKSRPGGPGVAAASWRFPDLGVAMSLYLFLGQEGRSWEKEGRPKAAILLLGGSAFSRGVLVWRPLRPVAGVSWSGAGEVAGHGPNPRRWVSRLPWRVSVVVPSLILTADLWRTHFRGLSGAFTERAPAPYDAAGLEWRGDHSAAPPGDLVA